jgi:hypothetical protein
LISKYNSKLESDIINRDEMIQDLKSEKKIKSDYEQLKSDNMKKFLKD